MKNTYFYDFKNHLLIFTHFIKIFIIWLNLIFKKYLYLGCKGKMTKISIGQKVKLATQPELVFVVTKINLDQSYEIQLQSVSNQVLSYDNIPMEMLRVVSFIKE